MSDYKYMTFMDVMRFLDAKVAVKQCPSCANEDWTLQHGRLTEKPTLVFSANLLGLSVPLEMAKNGTAQAMPVGRPVLPLICNVCGYMKIHDFAVVEKWVSANPAEAPNE